MITDYHGCEKCCKLRSLFDDYIIPFTKVCKYPEYEEVHKIIQNYVDKDEYTLEFQSEMKTMTNLISINVIRRKRITSMILVVVILNILKWYISFFLK